ncbi:MAG: hypothetical protein IKN50_06060 [Clostridia bacterium]|nr:hypothetical protein [Clostridia bacterium]MBR3640153.1 hypothetical protein [Clostridia bacterium]
MNKKFVFSMWTYNDVSEFTPDEVDVWADCGMNVPMSPAVGLENVGTLSPYLDRAEKRGIKLIANVAGIGYSDYMRLGEEAYTERVEQVVDRIGHYPALYGFYVGDEPQGGDQIEAAYNCIRINKKAAPDLTPFLNYRGGTVGFSKEELGGRTPGEWMKRVHDETGIDVFTFDEYSQMVNDGGGKTIFFDTAGTMSDMGKESGCDVWGCLLSSGHHVFAAPNETDIRWQINMSAALGLRGVMWFRFYDRVGANELIGSPIDEYGNKTEAYFAMLRCQRRFSDNYGEIFMKLNHKKTYAVKSDRGVFPEFTEGDHELIKSIRPEDEAIVSFFEDENGVEYLCVVHAVTKHYGVVRIAHDAEKCSLTEVRLNGKQCGKVGDDEGGEFYFIPAGLKLLRIDRK